MVFGRNSEHRKFEFFNRIGREGSVANSNAGILINLARKLSQFWFDRTNRLVSVGIHRYVINPNRLGCRFPPL